MQNINGILEKYIASGNLPSAVAGVANASGTLYMGAAGLRSLDHSEPMSTDTIFAIASMTKAITTVATLQLVEQGIIDLDTPITAYAPDLEHLKVLNGFDAQDKPKLSSPKSIPTTRQLLTHTSGYVYEIWNADAFKHVTSKQIDSLFAPSGNGMMAPLGFSPGERWEYGIGIDWAGVIVETLSGKSLDVYFHDHIFTPLAMSDTFYAVPDEKAPRRAAIHSRGDNGLEVVPNLGEPISGGGGLSSTISDYLRFMRAILNQGELEGERILQPHTVDMMFENHIGHLDVTDGPSQMPAFSNDFDMGFGTPAKWGLGFLIHQKQTESGRPQGSASWAGLFNSYFWIDRENDVCAVIGTQVLPFYDQHAIAMLKEFESTVYNNLKDLFNT
jgi:CubicO group peptidase (beta-lactamase class C family)